MCVFSFVRQKMNDERNVIFDVCCVLCENETIFFCLPTAEKNEENKQKNTLVFFPFFFFHAHEPFLSFFSQTSNVDAPQMLQISHTSYISFSTGNKRSLRFENAREHRFIRLSKEGCGVGTLRSVDTPSFEQNT